ncbi:FadR family transcriptional regulator [Ochrobactrum cytisi]|nr:FadR family transcriptional regulator [Brucella cytisi]
MGLLETAITGRKRHNSHAVVVGELGRGIVAGTIPAGSILPGDHELSLRFGVSRTVLREAMKTLAAKRPSSNPRPRSAPVFWAMRAGISSIPMC